MRPPVLPSGKPERDTVPTIGVWPRFNEAAGFTQRKPAATPRRQRRRRSFNEAAGFTQRKQGGQTRTQRVTSGFNEAAGFTQRKPGRMGGSCPYRPGFNEAAGFYPAETPARLAASP